MPLPHVGARTDSTTSYSYNARRGQLPRTRIGIVHRTRARLQYAPRVCTLVLFIIAVCVLTQTTCRTAIEPNRRDFSLPSSLPSMPSSSHSPTLSSTLPSTHFSSFIPARCQGMHLKKQQGWQCIPSSEGFLF